MQNTKIKLDLLILVCLLALTLIYKIEKII